MYDVACVNCMDELYQNKRGVGLFQDVLEYSKNLYSEIIICF